MEVSSKDGGHESYSTIVTFPAPSQEHSTIEGELTQLEKALCASFGGARRYTIYDLGFTIDDLKTSEVGKSGNQEVRDQASEGGLVFG